MKREETKELLKDYIEYHYKEGTISNDQRTKMYFAADKFLEKNFPITIDDVFQEEEDLPENCPYCEAESVGEAYGIYECFQCLKTWR